jgi:hypothetical protein
MVKTVCIISISVLCLNLFSQQNKIAVKITKSFIEREYIATFVDLPYDTLQCRFKMVEKSAEMKMHANKSPIVKTITDTLGYDSLLQYYYTNGNLYYQVTYMNGKKNGWREEFHPNGFFYQKQLMRDNYYSDSNNCSEVTYNQWGEIDAITLCGTFNGRKVYYYIYYCNVRTLCSIYVYARKTGTPIACYDFDKHKWGKFKGQNYYCNWTN